MKIWAGAWLNWSVRQLFTIAMSSTTVARCGSIVESSAPHWPWRAKAYCGPSTAASGRMKAYRWPPITSGGIGLPSMAASLGLWSKRSSWLGAPAMKSWITALARPGVCGGRGSSGPAAARAAAWDWLPSDSATSPASAILPTPMPQSRKKCRRVTSSRWFMVAPTA